MAKEITGYLKLQVKGGQANPAPPIGPALGSKGLNIMDFCKQFNARSQDKPGQVLPVLITIYNDKSFDFVIKTPPAAVLIMEAIKIQKGSKEPNRLKVGSISRDQIKKIAELKTLQTAIDALIQKHSEQEEARIKSLVKIYEGMKPKEAGRVFETLDIDTLFMVTERMKERKLSPIMAAIRTCAINTIVCISAKSLLDARAEYLEEFRGDQ